MSVIRYVNRLRVEAAKRLLIGSKLRVNEIAYQVGFDFYRVFKAAADASPAAFRKSYTSERTDPETI